MENMASSVQRQLSKISLSMWLTLLACCWGIYLYKHGLSITGPFIFGDELTYFSFARNFAQGKSILPFTQYGPLYPILTSFLFTFGNAVKTYKLIKIFNVLVFISTVIPAYLLGKTLFTNQWLRILLPFCAIMTPFSGLIYLVWAEPLYIALFYWACFLLCTLTKNPTLLKSILCGTFIALLYYTKPAAGLIIQIAAFSTLILSTFIIDKSLSWRAKGLNALALVICLGLTLPWMMHYHHLGLSIVGYPTATAELAQHLQTEGYLTVISNILYGLFYQFSYVFIGSWGMLGVCFGLLITKWQNLNTVERNMTLFILLSTLGLIALSAVGMASFAVLSYKMPNGRYFSLLLPLLTTLTLHLLFKPTPERKSQARILFAFIFISTAIAMIATPLYSRSPLAFNSMPELSAIIYIIDNALISWRAVITEPSLLLRINVALIFGTIAVCITLLRHKTYGPFIASTLIAAGMLFSTLTEQYYLHCIAIGQSGINNIFIYMIKHHIDPENVSFDKKLEISNIPFMTQFWVDKLATYNDAEHIATSNKKGSYFISADELKLKKEYSSYQYSIYKIDQN
jgi:hypothetical protein